MPFNFEEVKRRALGLPSWEEAWNSPADPNWIAFRDQALKTAKKVPFLGWHIQLPNGQWTRVGMGDDHSMVILQTSPNQAGYNGHQKEWARQHGGGTLLEDIGNFTFDVALPVAGLVLAGYGIYTGLEGAAAAGAGAAAGGGALESAALIEAGTVGFEGLAMEGAALGGGLEAAGVGAFGGFDAGLAAAPELAAGGAGADALAMFTGENIAETYLGEELFAEGTADWLFADTAGTSDLTANVVGNAPVSGVETGAFDMGQFTPQEAGGIPSSQVKPGVIDSVLDFSNKYPAAALGVTTAGAQLAGGVVAGVGASQRQEDQQQHERELLEQRIQKEKELEEWKRQFTQGGSYFDAKPKIRPGPSKVLTRPGGTPVYGPGGMISTMMR